MDQILEQFLSEARDNLSYLDKHLPELKNKDEETINSLFRAAHTLKGGAGLVGFSAVQEITHKAEDLLDAYRMHKIEYSDDLLDALYDAIDESVELIDAAEEKGSVEVDVDFEKIEEIKKNIEQFLTKNINEPQSQTGEEQLDTQLNISYVYVGEFIDYNKISDIDMPIFTPKITNELLNENNYWIIDMDLDEDTIKLGNDPYYILYLTNEGDIPYVKSIINCQDLKNDPYLWKTRIVAVVYSNKEMLEDALYNVIDDVILSPLSVENLFKTTLDMSDTDVYNDFIEEFSEIVKTKKFDKIEEQLATIIDILNKESKEGYVLNLLAVLLNKYETISKEFSDILNIALAQLEITIEEQQVDTVEVKDEKIDIDIDVDTKSKQKETSPKVDIPQEQLDAAKNILESQIKALSFAKDNDESFIKRTKLILNNVSKSLSIDCKLLDSASTKEHIREIIEKIINKIMSIEEQLGIEKPQEQHTQTEEKTELPKPTTPTKQEKEQKIKNETIEHIQKKSDIAHISKTVKIDQSVIDELMDIVGELLVMKNALPYIANSVGNIPADQSKRELLNKYEEISRLTDRFQDRVMGMRLLPLSYIFGRYPKLVRELSKKLNKKIKYIEEGGETKIDKTMIEKLADPLIHVIRNSIDHGIETTEERKRKGKSEEGTIKIKAKSKGDKVFIEISDDGAGINVDNLVRKVIDKQMMSIEELDKMSKQEKLSLIFLPGLSTKDEVSELSGRGVGGDAVKKVVEELNGKIYVESQLSKGTTITLELPVSVALTNVFHVKMNYTNYAISMEYLVETAKIEKDKIKTANHKPFIRIRGELIPLVFEKTLLGNDYENKNEYNVLVIQGSASKYGFVVDEFVGRLDVVQKPLEGVLVEHPFINGTSLLGNGEVIFILDPSKLVKG